MAAFWTIVSLMSTDTVFVPKLAVTRSGPPSPLKSPTVTELGPLPAPKFCAAWNVPSPLPSKIDTDMIEFQLEP